MAIVSLQSITKSYGSHTVLDDINLTIEAGQRIALVGRSGSGKTTVLRIICELEPPTTGRVLITRDSHHSVGYVPQSPSLLHAQTVRQNIFLPVRAVKSARVKNNNYAQVLKTLNIESLEDKYPYQLSRGQAQRVALARSLILQPDILVLDEPFASLDEFTKEDLNDELLRLSRELNTALLLVTHSIDEAVYVTDTTYILCENQKGLKKISTRLSTDSYGQEVRSSAEFAKIAAQVRAAL